MRLLMVIAALCWLLPPAWAGHPVEKDLKDVGRSLVREKKVLERLQKKTGTLLQTLSEKGLMQTSGGRSAFSVLLTQDIAVIPMLAILPLLATSVPVRLNPDGSMQRAVDDAAHHVPSLVEGLPGWGVTLVTLGMVAAVILFGIYLTRPLFRFIHEN